MVYDFLKNQNSTPFEDCAVDYVGFVISIRWTEKLSSFGAAALYLLLIPTAFVLHDCKASSSLVLLPPLKALHFRLLLLC